MTSYRAEVSVDSAKQVRSKPARLPHRVGLRWKLVLPVWGCIAIVTVFLFLAAMHLTRSAMLDCARHVAAAHTVHLSSGADAVAQNLERAIQDSDVLAIAIYKPMPGLQRLRRVAVRSASDSTLRHFPLAIEKPANWNEAAPLDGSDVQGLYRATSVAMDEGKMLGAVRVVLNLSSAQRRLAEFQSWGGLIAVAFLLATYLLLHGFATWVIHRLAETADLVRDAASGSVDADRLQRAGREFDELRVHLSELAEHVAGLMSDNSELRDTQAGEEIAALEKRLDERSKMLEAAYVEMQTLDQSKETFLSNLSHEMRTPLTSIIAAEEILTDFADDDPATRPEFLSIIRSESQRLLNLISELLDLAKIEARMLQLHFDEVEISNLVESCAGEVFSQPRDNQVAFALTLSPEPIPCECDHERITRVIRSLIQDAFQSSPEFGTVKVTVGHTEDFAVITIEDDCPYSSDRATDLFDHREANDDLHEATLLGNGFAKKLVKAHGGRLGHAPTEKGGTKIELLLPLQHADRPTPVDVAAGDD